MKKEIINCLTWYTNKVAETVQYTNWSNEFCRIEIKESTDKLLEELNKHIDWNNLSEEECKELRFGKWESDEDIESDITELTSVDRTTLSSVQVEEIEEKIKSLKNSKGIRLIPLYLLPIVPIGTELINIGGSVIKYDGKNVDNDIRFGCIAYGVKIK